MLPMQRRIRRGQNYPVLHPQTMLLKARFSVQPCAKDLQVYDTLMRALMGCGYLQTRDTYYFRASHSQADSLINWANPGTYTSTVTGSPTFAAYRGWTGNGTDGLLDAGVAFSALTNWTLNSAGLSVYVLNSLAGVNLGPIGSRTGGSVFARFRNTSNQAAIRVNDATSSTFANSNTDGHLIAVRSASNARQAWRNGASLGTDTTASVSVTTGNVHTLADASGFSSFQVAIDSVGGVITPAQVATVYAAETAALQAFGAV